MTDIIKISKIKKKSQLKKYNINKPIYRSNYLFHYLILANNLVGLKLSKYPINMVNGDDYNGLMLAAKEGKFNILYYLIRHYPEYIYNKNKTNMTFLHYIDPSSDEYIRLLTKSKKINWNILFQTYSSKGHVCFLDILFKNGKYSTIKKTIDILHNTIDYSIYMSQPSYFNLFINQNLTSKHMIGIVDSLYQYDNNILYYADDMGYTIAYPIVLLNKKDLLHYIVKKCGEKLDEYSPISTNHIFIISYNLGIKTNNFTNCRYILKHVMKNHDFSETDVNGNNMIHFILETRLELDRGDKYIENDLLSRYNDWTQINMEKISPLDLIISLDYKTYHTYVKRLDKSYITKEYIDSIKNTKWKRYIKKLPKMHDTTKIKMIKTSYIHSNMFQARFTDTVIFAEYLITRHKSLYLPIYNKPYSAEWKSDFKLPDDSLKEYSNFPWFIIWNEPNKYWIHPQLNQLIKTAYDSKRYTYAFVILSLRVQNGGLHATLILYDFKRKIVERFDPYGNTSILDRNMDEILEKELALDIDFKYVSPSAYFPVSGFQTLSDENNTLNQKLGDFGGYCLAWCFWYIEHRLLNNNVDPKTLIRKTLNRFMSMKMKPMEYIRNYSNSISQYRLKYFKRIGLGENIGSNENLTDDEHDILFKSIIKYHQ